MVFYNLFYYFWGQHCWWTEKSIKLVTILLFVTSFYCPQFLKPQCPTVAPASLNLVQKELGRKLMIYVFSVCEQFDIFSKSNDFSFLACMFAANSKHLVQVCQTRGLRPLAAHSKVSCVPFEVFAAVYWQPVLNLIINLKFDIFDAVVLSVSATLSHLYFVLGNFQVSTDTLVP